MKGSIGCPTRIAAATPHIREPAGGPSKELSAEAKFRLTVFVVNDNGSENMKEVEAYLAAEGITQYWAHPRLPGLLDPGGVFRQDGKAHPAERGVLYVVSTDSAFATSGESRYSEAVETTILEAIDLLGK